MYLKIDETVQFDLKIGLKQYSLMRFYNIQNVFVYINIIK